MPKTQLTWYGQSAYKIVTPGGKILLVDPWIKNPVNPNGEKDVAALKKVDVIFLTHGHGDHLGETVEIGKATGAKLVATMDLAVAITKLLGYPEENATVETTGFFGGRVPILDGEVISTLVPSVHGGAIANNDSATPYTAGPASGVVIEVKDGPTFYHTGDTDVFSDMSLISRFNKIDIMLACIGDHFTMGPERAALAVKLVGPSTVIPHHYGTFPVLTGTPEAFRAALKKEGCEAELRVMEVGETLEL